MVAASLPATLYPSWSDVSYVPSGFTATPNQKCNIYRGLGPRRRKPTLIVCNMTGWNTTARATAFSATGGTYTGTGSILTFSALPYLLLLADWNVVSMTATITNDLAADGTALLGKGLFRKDTDTDGAGTALFSYGSFAEKDVMWVAQFLRRNFDTYGVDHDIIGSIGLSAGGSASLWATLAQDYGGNTGFHKTESTRPNFAMAITPQMLYPTIDATSSALLAGMHFPKETGVAANDWNTVAVAYSGAAGTDASNNGADFSRLEFASPLRIAWDPTVTGATNIQAMNRTVPLWLYSNAAVPSTWDGTTNPTFSDDPTDAPWTVGNYTGRYGDLGVGNDPFHNAVHLYLFKELALANGMAWATQGGLSCLTVASAAKAASTWGATKPRQDVVLDGINVGVDSPITQHQYEWLRALERRL